ncbi:MAG TPA: hypothetical protein VG144_10165 [Gaiellaceae bacterium]|nr:hypothetical protein [Gaiellaceae bacterium]
MPLAPLGLFRLRNLAIPTSSAWYPPRRCSPGSSSRALCLREASGDGPLAALTGGYHAAFLIGALFAAGAAFIGGVFLQPKDMPAHEHEEAVGVPAVAEADSGARPR